jgi:hypothetical protein
VVGAGAALEMIPEKPEAHLFILKLQGGKPEMLHMTVTPDQPTKAARKKVGTKGLNLGGLTPTAMEAVVLPESQIQIFVAGVYNTQGRVVQGINCPNRCGGQSTAFMESTDIYVATIQSSALASLKEVTFTKLKPSGGGRLLEYGLLSMAADVRGGKVSLFTAGMKFAHYSCGGDNGGSQP